MNTLVLSYGYADFQKILT